MVIRREIVISADPQLIALGNALNETLRLWLTRAEIPQDTFDRIKALRVNLRNNFLTQL
jgi:hypothetical protein